MKKLLLILYFCLISASYSAEPKKLIVLLDWFANPNHAPLFVAQQEGFFKEQGLEVELIGPADPSDPPKLVAAGKADIAITYQPQFIQHVDRGLPLIRIGNLIDKPLSCLVVLRNSPIKTLHDLKDKSVGYSVGDINTLSLKVMLEKNGLHMSNIKGVNVHYDLTQAILTQKIDAVTGMMRNFELIQMELAGKPGQAFYPEQNGVPSYSELIFVINKSHLHDPRFKGFLKALQKGYDFLQKNPEKSWLAFAKQHPELNDELNRRAWIATLPYFAKQPADYDKNQWQHFIRFMHANGLIHQKYSVETYTKKLI